MESPSDEEPGDRVWLDALEGSPEAWGELFTRHGPAIYAYCYRRTEERSAAEDLTSTVFLEAWKVRTSAGAKAAGALPWLYGIATMLSRNHQRTLRRYSAALERMGPTAGALPEPDPAAEVAERIDAQRHLRRVRTLLDTLHQNDRDVLELAAVGTLGIAEIAAALDIPVGTAKSRLARARRRLNDLLARSNGQATESAPPLHRALQKEV
jgi:RNA polymerase sigma-70 factor (ECF subfamily)